MLISHNREKLINAIIYFCKETRVRNRLKLYKLLYHLDFRHYGQTGRSVTGLEYFAWPEGPVPVDLENEITSPREDLKEKIEFYLPSRTDLEQALEIKLKGEFDPSVFTKREMELLQETANAFALSSSDEMIPIAPIPDAPKPHEEFPSPSDAPMPHMEFSMALSPRNSPSDPWDRVFIQDGKKQQKIPFEYALIEYDAEWVKNEAKEHEEMLANYS